MTKFKNAMVAAIIAVAAIGCGVAPDEGVVSYDDNGRGTPTAPAEPTVDTDTDAEVIEDGCEAFGLVYDEIAGECVTGIEPTEAVEEGEAFGFTVTPGNMHFLATWEADALVSYYTIEKWREVSSSPQETTSAETEWTFATAFCTAHSFKLVATLTDGSTVETSLLGPFKPTNCE